MKKPTGPASYFRPKDPRPVTLNLTKEGRDLLSTTADRTDASRADVVEWLLRRFHEQVVFDKETLSA